MTRGVQKRVETRKPHFFKVLLGDFSHRLRIPPAFTKHISKEASNNAILEGPGGDQWWVNISRGGCNDTYFDAGWKAFMEDHCLHEHNFLVFKYNGAMHFSVLIFDKSCCEREDAFLTIKSQKSGYEGRGKRESRNEMKQDFGCQSQKSKKRSRVQIESGQYEPSARNMQRKRKKVFRQPTPMIRGKVCYNPALFNSKFPFFRKSLTKISVMPPYMMHIPSNFHGYLPKNKNKFIIQDPNGKDWELFIVGGEKISFSAGWPAFCRGNSLKEGDICIFEMLDTSTFRLYVYPAGEDTGHKKLSGKGQGSKEIESNFGGCDSPKLKMRRRVQVEAGQYVYSSSKVEMKLKEKFLQPIPRVKRKACLNPGSFNSRFPFFTKCITKTNVIKPSVMHIPTNFYGYLQKKRRKFILQDPNGKNWEVFIGSWKKGSIHFSRGLVAFCRENNPKEGDTFIFELQNISTFRVHIYRTGGSSGKTKF